MPKSFPDRHDSVGLAGPVEWLNVRGFGNEHLLLVEGRASSQGNLGPVRRFKAMLTAARRSLGQITPIFPGWWATTCDTARMLQRHSSGVKEGTMRVWVSAQHASIVFTTVSLVLNPGHICYSQRCWGDKSTATRASMTQTAAYAKLACHLHTTHWLYDITDGTVAGPCYAYTQPDKLELVKVQLPQRGLTGNTTRM